MRRGSDYWLPNNAKAFIDTDSDILEISGEWKRIKKSYAITNDFDVEL